MSCARSWSTAGVQMTAERWQRVVCSARTVRRVSRSDTFSLWSPDAETARLRSGVTATPRTESEWRLGQLQFYRAAAVRSMLGPESLNRPDARRLVPGSVGCRRSRCRSVACPTPSLSIQSPVVPNCPACSGGSARGVAGGVVVAHLTRVVRPMRVHRQFAAWRGAALGP